MADTSSILNPVFRPVRSLGWVDPIWEMARSNSIRRMFFYLSLIFIFLRFSMVHEVVGSRLGINLRIVLLFGIPSILGVLFSGGLGRTFRHKIAWLWLGFLCMLFLSTPFSTWIGGSVQMLSTYVQSEWPMLLVMGGLAASWAEVEILISTMTLTAFASLVMAKVLLQERGGRLELDLRGGSISNSNDLAAQLLLLMPFMLLIAFNPKKNVVYRLLAISGSALATYMILGSASRGAMVSLGAMALLLFFLANGAKKLLALLLLPLVLIGVFVSLSGTAQRRLLNFSTTNSAGDNFETQEAIDSARSRSYIFMKSLQYTFEHPFLGVGPGQVNSYDGQVSVREGRARGHWMGTHNSYTMISSECGIPAFLFFTGALILSFTTMNGIRKTCGYREDLAHIKRVVEAMMLSQMGFYVAITFLTIGYRNTLPAMGGLAIVVAITARAEIYRIDKAKQEAQTATLPVNPLTGRVTPVLATAPAAPQPQWVAQSGRPRLNPKFGRG